MQVIKLDNTLNAPREYENMPLSISIGVFDGLHKGHKEVLSRLVDYSLSHSFLPVVFTFNRNPKDIFYLQSMDNIISDEEKYTGFERLGIKTTFIIDFTDNIKKMSGEEFLSLILRNFDVRKIFAGKDWSIGNPKSSLSSLDVQEKHTDLIEIVDDVKIEEKKISSTLIREEVKKANSLTKEILDKYF